MQVYEASIGSSDKILPSHCVFAGVAAPISTIRLAAFTGARFFGNMIHHPPPTSKLTLDPNAREGEAAPGPPPQLAHCTSGERPQHPAAASQPLRTTSSGAAVNCIEAAGIVPETMDVLLRVMEGAAPSELSVQRAGEVFEAMDYCLATPELFKEFAYYLQPMVVSLEPAQASILSSPPHHTQHDDLLCTSKTHTAP